ncbi:hypothetical protein JB92DRAFT_2890497 [Gautieria morchelliformis]|nr:hypothetical protein JB92DRAFT_2890497 [Gautieria morchelliformis]
MHSRTDLWGPDGVLFSPCPGPFVMLACLASEFDPNRVLDARHHKVFLKASFLNKSSI